MEQINPNDEQQKTELRSIRRRVEDNSKVIDDLVSSIVAKYKRELDDMMDWAKELLSKKQTLEDIELEALTLKIPLFMYYASGGLETLGIEGDNAKAIKLEAFNKVFLEKEGTIPDKTKRAELGTFSEHLIEVAFTRAYKKLKLQLEMAEHVYSGAKKVYDMRIKQFEVAKNDRGRMSPGKGAF